MKTKRVCTCAMWFVHYSASRRFDHEMSIDCQTQCRKVGCVYICSNVLYDIYLCELVSFSQSMNYDVDNDVKIENSHDIGIVNCVN